MNFFSPFQPEREFKVYMWENYSTVQTGIYPHAWYMWGKLQYSTNR